MKLTHDEFVAALQHVAQEMAKCTNEICNYPDASQRELDKLEKKIFRLKKMLANYEKYEFEGEDA